jgi:hypothetical protein
VITPTEKLIAITALREETEEEEEEASPLDMYIFFSLFLSLRVLSPCCGQKKRQFFMKTLNTYFLFC